MSKEELEEISNNIQLQMIVEQNIGYKKEYSYGLQEKIKLYNYVLDLKQAFNEIKEIINDCKKLMDHEFEWEEQVENILEIAKKASEEE